MSQDITPQPESKKTTKKAVESEVSLGSGNIEQIRDILFGKHIKDFDKRFARLEQNLLNELANTRDETKKIFSTLENFTKNEIRTITDQIKNEQKKREESDDKLDSDIKAFLKRFNEFQEEMLKFQREIREQLLSQSNTLTDEMARQRNEIMRHVNNAIDELQYNKTDRNTLASLFNEIAFRLSGEDAVDTEE